MAQSYFLGCNSADGFVSIFNELYDPYDGWTLYIIKGGPGTGKSTLMKKLCSEADKKKISYEKIYCSSDPDSLDGIIFNDLKISVADGTSPHILEPKFPGAAEHFIMLNNFWNKEILAENRDSIIKYSTLISAEHAKCVKFLKASQIIQNEIKRIVLLNTDTEKLKRFILREKRKNETDLDINKIPQIRTRILDAVTPKGILFQKETVYSQCDDVIIIKDGHSVISPIIIDELIPFYLKQRKDIIKCKSFINPLNLCEHIILPEIKKAYITDNYNFNLKTDANYIHATRFYRKISAGEKEILNSALKAKLNAIEKASGHLKNAKELHDKLESYYKEAMNFDELNKYSDIIIKTILDK